MRITGFDKLQRDFREAQAGLRGLNGNIAKLHYDPRDQQSVNAAIREMGRAADRKAGRFRSNPMIASIAQGLKASYRAQILADARKGRRG